MSGQQIREALKSVFIAVVCLMFGGLLALAVNTYIQDRDHGLAEYARVFDTADEVAREQLTETYLDEYSAAQLLDALEKKYAYSVCHTSGHPIGRVVYRRTQDLTESLKMCGSQCTYGCFHGVLMEMFSTDSDTLGGVINEESPEEYLAHVKDVAADLCDSPEILDHVRMRFCYHGLGHVFAYITDQNLKSAIQSCDVVPTGAARETCVSGAFMEYLFAASSTRVLNTKDAKPCDAYPTFLVDCYRYKARGWITVWGSAVRAMNHCDAFKEHEFDCVHAIAYNAALNTSLSNPAAFDKLCGGLSGAAHESCTNGALMKAVILNDGTDTEDVCLNVAARFREQCVINFKRYHEATF